MMKQAHKTMNFRVRAGNSAWNHLNISLSRVTRTRTLLLLILSKNSSYFYMCTLMCSSQWQSVALWQVATVNRLSYGALLCVLIKPKFKV